VAGRKSWRLANSEGGSMSAADQFWLKQTVERQIEDIAADVGDIWKAMARLLECQTMLLNVQTDRLNELVVAHNNIAEGIQKLIYLSGHGPASTSPLKPVKRKPKLKIVKDEEPTP
jgi:hypothetical protein